MHSTNLDIIKVTPYLTGQSCSCSSCYTTWIEALDCVNMHKKAD